MAGAAGGGIPHAAGLHLQKNGAEVEIELIVQVQDSRAMEQLKKRKIRLIILLAVIWFVITLPLPWIVGNPDVKESSFYTILGIIGIMSIPFVMLGIVWTLKPELTT